MNAKVLPSRELMTGSWLAELRRNAVRRNVWFSVLLQRERSAVELTIRCVERIESWRLALVIGRIVCKVLRAFRSRFLERVKVIGYDLAERVSSIAVGWGYTEAEEWKQDAHFVRFLGANAVNSPSDRG